MCPTSPFCGKPSPKSYGSACCKGSAGIVGLQPCKIQCGNGPDIKASEVKSGSGFEEHGRMTQIHIGHFDCRKTV